MRAVASWAWTSEALSAGLEMTHDDMAPGYVRVHRIQGEPPAVLPSAHGELIELWAPSADDMARDDWRVV